MWLIGVGMGQAYANEGQLLSAWVGQYGRGGLPAETLIVGDGLYGYRAGLLLELEGAGWLPVMRVRSGVWQGVRASSRLRARARAEAHPEMLRGRYRIEQVFGSVKGAYGSYVEARSFGGARSWVWGLWVLWKKVGLSRVSGDGSFFFVLSLFLCAVPTPPIFRTPSCPS